MSPNETLFLESTNKIVKNGKIIHFHFLKFIKPHFQKKLRLFIQFQFLDVSNSSFVQFQIWDFPGQIDFFDATFDSEQIFTGCGALIFVIDARVSFRC